MFIIVHVPDICGKYSYSCITIYCTTFVDVSACWLQPHLKSILCNLEEASMQLHTLLDIEAIRSFYG